MRVLPRRFPFYDDLSLRLWAKLGPVGQYRVLMVLLHDHTLSAYSVVGNRKLPEQSRAAEAEVVDGMGYWKGSNFLVGEEIEIEIETESESEEQTGIRYHYY